ncbi:MAG TPA: hypothetical protein VF719_08470, partial [Abditibacteriaceae bacterium]
GVEQEPTAIPSAPQAPAKSTAEFRTLFDAAPEPHPVVELLKSLDIDNLTPMEAMLKLQELRKQAIG